MDAYSDVPITQSGPLHGGRRTILYVDGFAGPGIYKGGEPGSPVIAIDAAVHHRNFPTPVEMLFIEADPDRFKKLEEVIAAKIGQLQSHPNLHVVGLKKGDCDAVLGELLDDYSKQGVQFGPALAFLDQFGYGAVSMELIKKILEVPICEIFTYLNYKEINRFITDHHKAPALDRAFGGAEWKDCIPLPEEQRRTKLLDLYKAALKTRGGAEFVSSFLMHDSNDR